MSDILIATAFTVNQKNVGAAELNGAINNAVIQPAFFTGKAADTTPDTADLVLVYDVSGGVFKKVTLANLIFDHANLLSGRVSATAHPDDSVLIYDDSISAYRKTTISDLINSGLPTNFISGKTGWTTPLGADELLIYDTANTTIKKITRANLFYQWWDILNIDDATDFAGNIASGDKFYMRDVSAGQNRALSLGQLINSGVLHPEAVADLDEIILYDASLTTAYKAQMTNIKTYMQTGCIIKVQQSAVTSASQINTTGAWTDLGLSVSITPRDTNSKVLVNLSISGTCKGNEVWFKLVRDSTDIAIGDAGGAGSERASTGIHSRSDNDAVQNVSLEYLDSPAKDTSTTYKVQYYLEAGEFWWNRNDDGSGSNDKARFISTITAKEVAA